MIRLTRLNGQELVVNSELIKFIESTPDTMVTLTNGDKVVVRESADAVVEKAVLHARRIRTPIGEKD